MSFWKCFSCLRFPTDDCIIRLDYSNGTLTDVPPDISQFERTLEELYLSSNRISDLPPELFYCQGLRILKVNDNELETIPNAIGSFRQLQVLDLSRNSLTNIPDNLKSCKYLTHLDLSLNNLQRLPDALTNLITLEELYLNETYLEFLPANFGRLVNLRILELRSNNLMTLPKSISRFSELQRLDIGANEFAELPEVIGQLHKLRELWIDSNRIRRIFSNISNLRELIHFEASNNQLITLPNEISCWRNLEVLSLSLNDLESLPFSLGMLKRLITLKCDSNQLKELPDSICHLEQLEEIIIDHNYLIRLPSTIGLLRQMKFLLADENMLRRLPNEITSCAGLTVLSLRGNKLTEIPADIGHLKNLRVFNIVDNQIVTLPVSVLNLNNLSALWLNDNQSQPLVPLQYVDTATKSALTCFMLPQIRGDTRIISSQTSGKHENNEQQWFMHQEYHQQQQQLTSNDSTNNPVRKICFADETRIKPTEAITTRLMRSPTPYPKELRSMARFATRNQQQQQQNFSPAQQLDMQSSNTKTSPVRSIGPHVKEARVLHNSQLIANGSINTTSYFHHSNSNPSPSLFLTAATTTTTTSSPSSASTPILISDCDNVIGAQSTVDCNITSDSIAHPVDSDDLQYYYHGIDQQQQQQQPFTGNNYYDSSIGSLKLRDSINSGDDYVDSNFYTNSKKISHWSDNTIIPADNNQYHHQLRYSQPLQPQYRSQPPPYHIAKAYTKMSREDLLIYDSIRNRNSTPEIMKGSLISPTAENQHHNSPSPPFDSNCNTTDETIDTESIISSKRNFTNNSDCCNISNGNREKETRINDQIDIRCSSVDEGMSDVSLIKNQLMTRSQTSHWLFGLHRNPTVKQVTLRKDPTIGFEIKEIANQGIFVSITVPNTPAEQLLRIDDKILDVDGIDFSKINCHEAQKILIDSGPIVNIMISRT